MSGAAGRIGFTAVHPDLQEAVDFHHAIIAEGSTEEQAHVLTEKYAGLVAGLQ